MIKKTMIKKKNKVEKKENRFLKVLKNFPLVIYFSEIKRMFCTVGITFHDDIATPYKIIRILFQSLALYLSTNSIIETYNLINNYNSIIRAKNNQSEYKKTNRDVFYPAVVQQMPIITALTFAIGVLAINSHYWSSKKVNRDKIKREKYGFSPQYDNYALARDGFKLSALICEFFLNLHYYKFSKLSEIGHGNVFPLLSLHTLHIWLPEILSFIISLINFILNLPKGWVAFIHWVKRIVIVYLFKPNINMKINYIFFLLSQILKWIYKTYPVPVGIIYLSDTDKYNLDTKPEAYLDLLSTLKKLAPYLYYLLYYLYLYLLYLYNILYFYFLYLNKYFRYLIELIRIIRKRKIIIKKPGFLPSYWTKILYFIPYFSIICFKFIPYFSKISIFSFLKKIKKLISY